MRNSHKARILWFLAVGTAILANFVAAFSAQDAYGLFLRESFLQQDADQDGRPTRLVVRTSSMTTKDASISHEKISQSRTKKATSSGARSQSKTSKYLIGLSDSEVFTEGKSKSLPPQTSRDASPDIERKRRNQNSIGTTIAQSTLTDQELRRLPRTDPRRPKSRWSPKLTPEEGKERKRLRQKSIRDAWTSEERARWNKRKSVTRAEAMHNMTPEQHSEFLSKRRARDRAAREKAKEGTPNFHDPKFSERRNKVRAYAQRARKRIQEDPELKLAYNARRRERHQEVREAERRGIRAPPGRTKNQYCKESSSDPSISSLSEKSRDYAGGRKKSPNSPRQNLVAASQSQSMLAPSSPQQLPQGQNQPTWSQGSGGSIPVETAAKDLFNQWRAESPDEQHPLW